jgi:hypothetical protein
MGNFLEIDLTKYGCSCVDQEDGGFLDFMDNIKNKATPYINTMIGERSRNLSKSNLSSYTDQTHSPRGISSNSNSNKKYESIVIMPKNTSKKKLDIDEKKIDLTENDITLFNNKNYLKEFEYSETEINNSNSDTININKEKSNIEEDEEKEDIKNFNLNTDYFQLANQIAESIKELKNNFLNSTPNKQNINNEDNFENAIKRAGKITDTVCFNDIIGCIKKITDIISEVILSKEKIYLGIANKFKKKDSITHFINFSDEQKIVEIPNFDGIKYDLKKKLGRFNNPKFKFNKFTLKGSFPNEILIWKLIGQNMDEIKKIIKDNYYCCVVLLHKDRNEDENETIIYLISKL